MEETSQLPYPSMLGSLEPSQAVQALNERVKRIGKVNTEIADWLLERRKIEDAYVLGLKKLASRPLPGSNSELGIFTTPWQKIVISVESIAASHHTFSTKIETDVESTLRTFASQNREMQSMSTIQSNLSTLSKELIDAQEKSDKLSKKGSKANVQKVEAATTRLESATTTWDSQTPFIFEKLQSLDELRLNTLRDVLTQYETHEVDCIERNRATVESTIGSLIEFDTQTEILSWSESVTTGKQKRERQANRSLSRPARGAQTGSGTIQQPPPVPSHGPSLDDTGSEHSRRNNNDGGSDEQSTAFTFKKSRIGTMLGRRRQSLVGNPFGRSSSPNRGFAQFGSRGNGSRDGPSPRASSTNLQDSSNVHLSPLPESPVSPNSIRGQNNGVVAPGNTNGTQIAERIHGSGSGYGNLPDLSDVQPPPGPPPSHTRNAQSGDEPLKDSEGFTVPPAASDPISQAEQDAANEAHDQQFKLDIRNEPIKEEDADAQAALSNVANTLRLGNSNLATPNRKSGTVRGRRDVRNTIYVPAGTTLDVMNPDSHGGIPPSPNLPANIGMGTPQASDVSHTTDAQSIRSSRSTGANGAIKHPDMHRPGLNASIVEVVTSTFDNGEVTSSAVVGEIAFIFNIAPSTPPSATETLIRFKNFPALNAIGPNHAFAKEISPNKPGEYTLNLNAMTKPTAVPGFKYKVHIDEANLTSYSPLLLKSAWKNQDHKMGLVIEYKLNPAFSNEAVTLNNLGFVATYEGPKASGCQTKPSGIHVKDRRMVYWRLNDTTLIPGDETWHRIVARLVGAEGAEPQPGTIEARWEITNGSEKMGSGLGISQLRLDAKGKAKAEEEDDDPFADDTQAVIEENGGQSSPWVEVETARKLISGKYEAR